MTYMYTLQDLLISANSLNASAHLREIHVHVLRAETNVKKEYKSRNRNVIKMLLY